MTETTSASSPPFPFLNFCISSIAYSTVIAYFSLPFFEFSFRVHLYCLLSSFLFFPSSSPSPLSAFSFLPLYLTSFPLPPFSFSLFFSPFVHLLTFFLLHSQLSPLFCFFLSFPPLSLASFLSPLFASFSSSPLSTFFTSSSAPSTVSSLYFLFSSVPATVIASFPPPSLLLTLITYISVYCSVIASLLPPSYLTSLPLFHPPLSPPFCLLLRYRAPSAAPPFIASTSALLLCYQLPSTSFILYSTHRYHLLLLLCFIHRYHLPSTSSFSSAPSTVITSLCLFLSLSIHRLSFLPPSINSLLPPPFPLFHPPLSPPFCLLLCYQLPSTSIPSSSPLLHPPYHPPFHLLLLLYPTHRYHLLLLLCFIHRYHLPSTSSFILHSTHRYHHPSSSAHPYHLLLLLCSTVITPTVSPPASPPAFIHRYHLPSASSFSSRPLSLPRAPPDRRGDLRRVPG
ncbi:hypothetical protein C7M84_005699 [Penaeus vannamei]|uniref:Uncharacterized protein n=1 Tax=Penaeus vannamei TaxID=6689 RepID=A0A3R7QE20_PENVA|nr:hypothetical protein C7M84_005699 [Penaeus vannamei]